jgi:hypothetical protein
MYGLEVNPRDPVEAAATTTAFPRSMAVSMAQTLLGKLMQERP